MCARVCVCFRCAFVTVVFGRVAGQVLGSGSYAEVKKAVELSTGKPYAIKIINKQVGSWSEDDCVVDIC